MSVCEVLGLDGCHAHLAFTWVLRFCAQGLGLPEPALYLPPSLVIWLLMLCLARSGAWLCPLSFLAVSITVNVMVKDGLGTYLDQGLLNCSRCSALRTASPFCPLLSCTSFEKERVFHSSMRSPTHLVCVYVYLGTRVCACMGKSEENPSCLSSGPFCLFETGSVCVVLAGSCCPGQAGLR